MVKTMIEAVDEKTLIERFEFMSRNVDLKTKGLSKGEIYRLIERTFRGIRVAINILKR